MIALSWLGLVGCFAFLVFLGFVVLTIAVLCVPLPEDNEPLICVCRFPLDVSSIGECQRCHRPVLSSMDLGRPDPFDSPLD